VNYFLKTAQGLLNLYRYANLWESTSISGEVVQILQKVLFEDLFAAESYSSSQSDGKIAARPDKKHISQGDPSLTWGFVHCEDIPCYVTDRACESVKQSFALKQLQLSPRDRATDLLIRLPKCSGNLIGRFLRGILIILEHTYL